MAIISNKVRWILAASLVFLIILATNLVDRKNFNIVKNSIETIYADRLVAKDILYDIAGLLWQKELAFVQEPDQFTAQTAVINEKIAALIDRFATTKLTAREEQLFALFRGNFAELQQVEADLTTESAEVAFREQLQLLRENLEGLSDIQLKQGKNELFESQRAIKAVDLFTTLEIYALIVIALVIQIGIFYTPSKKAGD